MSLFQVKSMRKFYYKEGEFYLFDEIPDSLQEAIYILLHP